MKEKCIGSILTRMFRPYKKLIRVYYDEETNRFLDPDGEGIYIGIYLHPRDVWAFRQKKEKIWMFQHRSEKGTACIIWPWM